MPLTKIDDRGLTTPIDLQDNEKSRYGNGPDLEIYHDGNATYIYKVSSEGGLVMGGDANHPVTMQLNPVNGENGIIVTPNDDIELYYDGVKKFETTSLGVRSYGILSTDGYINIANGAHLYLSDTGQAIFGNNSDLKMWHDGTNSHIKNDTNALILRSDAIRINNNGNTETMIKADANGAVELYHDNSKKFETYQYGVNISGTAKIESGGNFHGHDNVKFIAGTSEDLQIFHDGSNSRIADAGTGHLILTSNGAGVLIQDYASGQNMAKFLNAGAVELYHNYSKKLETSSTGVTVTGVLTTSSNIRVSGELDLGTTNGNKFMDVCLGDNYGFYLRSTSGEGQNHENLILANRNQGVKLYYDAAQKFETTSTGNLSTGVHKFITGNGSQSSDANVLHVVAGGTTDRGVMIGTGRSTGASQNNGMGYIDAINSESGGYGSQLQLRVDGNRVLVVGYQGNNRVGINTDHPSARLHVTDDSSAAGMKVVHSNGTAGIGIGYDTIQTLGSNTNNNLYIRAKGNEKLRLGANNNDVLGIEKDSRDVRFFTNAQGWSTQHFNVGGNYDMRVHRRRLNNGQNSVSTHNLFRLRRANWGWGHFEVRLYETYYSGSYVTRCRIIGHGQNGDNYGVRTMDDTWTNGGSARWGAAVQTTTASSSSPGDTGVYFTDVQATLPNYTYAICELIMVTGYQTNNANDGGSMATNSYTLWTP